MKTPVSMRPCRALVVLLAIFTGCFISQPLRAEFSVEVPALAAAGNSPRDPGAFTVKVLWWDQKPSPDPMVLRWANGLINALEYGHVRPGRSDRHATIAAFRYAVARTPSVKHTGTVNIQGVAYGSATMDGGSAGAVMAIGFIALFRGDSIQRGVALTGTLEPDGRIGHVGGIPGKVRAAAREGYHTVLIPNGQLAEPKWDIESLAIELDMTIREVRTIEEAYELMTGRSL